MVQLTFLKSTQSLRENATRFCIPKIAKSMEGSSQETEIVEIDNNVDAIATSLQLIESQSKTDR